METTYLCGCVGCGQSALAGPPLIGWVCCVDRTLRFPLHPSPGSASFTLFIRCNRDSINRLRSSPIFEVPGMTLLSRSVGRRTLPALRLFSCSFRLAWQRKLRSLPNQVPMTAMSPWSSPRCSKKEHLLQHPLDAEISNRCMKTFLQDLDPMKMYFYQSDYDSFAKDKDRLADMAQQGDITFAYTVYNTFLNRIDERVKMIDQILARRSAAGFHHRRGACDRQGHGHLCQDSGRGQRELAEADQVRLAAAEGREVRKQDRPQGRQERGQDARGAPHAAL